MADTPPSNYDSLQESASSSEGDMVDPKDAKKAQDRKRRDIQSAKDARKSNNYDERWKEFIQIYANKYPYTELDGYEDVVVPNMVFSTANVIVPSVAINSPKINVRANQMEDVKASEVVEAVVNHQWRAYRVQDQVRQAVKDFVLIGHGWAKVVWENEEGEVPLTAEEFTERATEMLGQKRAVLAENPDLEDQFPDDQEMIDSLPSKEMRITKDKPLVKRVSPFDMFIDPDAAVIEDARWIAQRSFIPIETARKNEDYDRSVRSRLVRKRKSKERDLGIDGDSETDIGGFAEIWEFYDLVNMQMCVFAEGTEGYLIAPVDSPFPDGHPFVFLPNYEVPERFYPVGDVETIFPLQVELGLTRTAQLNDRKRGRRITLFREAALGEQGMSDLRDGEDNVMIPVLKNEYSLDDVFRQVSSQGLPPEWYRADAQAMEDINIVSGVSEYARGGSSDIRRTATEVGVSQDYANARSADKLAKVEIAMAQIAERMIKLSQQFMDTEDVARVVSDNTVVDWVPYNRDAIQGEFTFICEAGSSQPQNESFRRQQAQQMMQAFGPMIGSGFLNDQEFLMEIMRLNGWSDPERFIGPGPQPMPPEAPPGAEQGGPPEQSEMAPPQMGM